jgi:hypothetical protein
VGCGGGGSDSKTGASANRAPQVTKANPDQVSIIGQTFSYDLSPF